MDYESSIRSVIHLFMTYGQTHQPFAEYGAPLLGVITVIAISLNGIRLLMDYAAPNEMIGKMINIIMIWGLASFVLTSSVPQMVDKGFTDLANKAVSVSGGNASPEEGVLQSMGKFTSVAMDIFVGRPEQQSQTQSSSPWYKKLGSWASEKWDSVVSGDMIMGIVNVFYKLFVALFIVVAGLLYVGQYLISQVMVQIGFMVMPIMVPWLVLESTAFLFDGWLKFMISAGLTKIVGAIIFGMSTDLLTAVVSLANQAGSSQVANFGLYSSIMILTALLAYLMLQTTSIAHGLMHGNASGKFMSPAKLSPGGASTSTSKGVQSTWSAVGRGFKDGIQSAKNGGGLKGGLSAGMRSAMGMKTPAKTSVPASSTPSAATSSVPTSKSTASIRDKIQSAKITSGR